MANNRLILRTLTSPWVTPVADVTKGSVLTHEDVDNNFIYLRGELIESAGFSGGNVILRKINGGTITVPTGAGANTFVTGGTYDVNTSLVTLTRNDDVTINISGLTDTVVTGFTYDNANSITLSQNQGEVDQVVLINTMTGLTVNGTLSATTVNAGDILSGGTNLNAIFQTIGGSVTGDTYVTGYTYDGSNNFTILRNNGQPDLVVNISTMTGLTVNGTISATTINAGDILSGGTNLNAIFQTVGGSGDTYVSGFTYDGANNITLSQSGGLPDLVVNISTMTGLTVNGTISATTVDAGDILSGGTNLNAIFQTIGTPSINLATDDLVQDAEPRVYNMNGQNLTFNNGYFTASRSSFGDVVNLNHSGGEIFFGGATGVGTGGSNLIHDTKFNVASSTINCHRDFANTIGLCMVNFTTTGGLNNYAVVENQDGPLYIISGPTDDLLFKSGSNDFIWLASGGTTDMRLDAGVISVATWEGVVVKEGFGGTAQSTYATGDILYASAPNTLSKLTAGNNGDVLQLNSGVPSWAISPGISTSGNTYTSGTTVIGNTIYFDRNDILSAYTADLTSIVSGATLTGANGITTTTGNTIELGGTLTQDTDIEGAHNLTFGNTFANPNLWWESTTPLKTFNVVTEPSGPIMTGADGFVSIGSKFEYDPGLNYSRAALSTDPGGVYLRAQWFNNVGPDYESYVDCRTGQVLLRSHENNVGYELNLASNTAVGPQSATFTDSSATPKGLEYGADYSATYTSRSLVDKEYVDNQITGATLTGANGITTTTGNTIELGGTLNKTTNIDGNGNDFLLNNGNFTLISGTDTVVDGLSTVTMGSATGTVAISAGATGTTGVSVAASNGQATFGGKTTYLNGDDLLNITSISGAVTISASGASGSELVLGANNVFTDNRGTTKGIEYAANYHTDYTDRSLVDKEYVDNQLTSGVTASNGLTEVGSDIQLGGILSSDTAISGASQSINFGVPDSQLANFNVHSVQGNLDFSVPGLTQDIDFNPTQVRIQQTDTGNGHSSDYNFINAYFNIQAQDGVNQAKSRIVGDSGTLRLQQSDTGDTTYSRIDMVKTGVTMFINSVKNNELYFNNDKFDVNIQDSGRLHISSGATSVTAPLAGNFFADFRTGATQSGLEYADDYSVNFNPLSLITKQYLDNAISGITGTTLTGANGITTTTGNTVELGGSLTQNTLITGEGKNLELGTTTNRLSNHLINASGFTSTSLSNAAGDITSVQSLAAGSVFIGATILGDSGGVQLGSGIDFTMSNSNGLGNGKARFVDFRTGTTAVGLEYAGNYHANYIDRSLVDKEYVDNQITGTTNDTFVTGFTYDNANNITISRNEGEPDLDINISTMTGLTVNGTLSATTVDAGDILSGGTNLSSIFATIGGVNTYTTGTTLVGTTLYFDRTDSLSAYTADLSTIGGGVSDGDKGDITVSSSGTVWNIDPGVVDETELANFAVTTGKIAQNAVTLTRMAQQTPGGLISYDGDSDAQIIPIGTSGHVLTSNGTGTTPTWQAVVDTYTTGSTLIGDTVYFDRTDSLSAYTLNLSAVTDDNAIHDNVDAEISAIATKSTLVNGDIFLIEDSEASDAKKSTTLEDIKDAVGSATGGTPGIQSAVQNYSIVNSASQAGLSGTQYSSKVIPLVNRTVSNMSYFVTQSSPARTVYVGIYDNSGTKLAEGSGNTTSTGIITATLDTSVDLVANTEYWFSILEGSGAPNFAATATFGSNKLTRSQFISTTPTGLAVSISAHGASTSSFWGLAF